MEKENDKLREKLNLIKIEKVKWDEQVAKIGKEENQRLKHESEINEQLYTKLEATNIDNEKMKKIVEDLMK